MDIEIKAKVEDHNRTHYNPAKQKMTKLIVQPTIYCIIASYVMNDF